MFRINEIIPRQIITYMLIYQYYSNIASFSECAKSFFDQTNLSIWPRKKYIFRRIYKIILVYPITCFYDKEVLSFNSSVPNACQDESCYSVLHKELKITRRSKIQDQIKYLIPNDGNQFPRFVHYVLST